MIEWESLVDKLSSPAQTVCLSSLVALAISLRPSASFQSQVLLFSSRVSKSPIERHLVHGSCHFACHPLSSHVFKVGRLSYAS